MMDKLGPGAGVRSLVWNWNCPWNRSDCATMKIDELSGGRRHRQTPILRRQKTSALTKYLLEIRKEMISMSVPLTRDIYYAYTITWENVNANLKKKTLIIKLSTF